MHFLDTLLFRTLPFILIWKKTLSCIIIALSKNLFLIDLNEKVGTIIVPVGPILANRVFNIEFVWKFLSIFKQFWLSEGININLLIQIDGPRSWKDVVLNQSLKALCSRKLGSTIQNSFKCN